MVDAAEILASPDYLNANAATKNAIFDKHIASSQDFTSANPATQTAIRARFGLINAPAAEARAPAIDAVPQGRSGRMREAFTRPADISNVLVQTLPELGERYKNIGIGAGQGALAAVPGLPGDVLSLAVDNPFTSEKIGNAMFGAAATPDVRAGRMLGGVASGFAAPIAAAKIVAPMKTAAEAAGLAKTGKALGLAQTVLDPVPAMLQGAVAAGGKTYNALSDAANYVIAPGVTAENRLARMVADPAAAAAAMRNTENLVTSGGPVSVSERLAAGNVTEPRIAAAQEALGEGKLAPQVQAAQQERIAAIQSNIQNVERELAQNVNAMTPAKAAELRVVRDGYLRSLAEAQAEATAAGGQIAGRIPNPSQMEVGQSLAEKAAIGSREATTEVISPAFKESFKLAGETPIVIDNVLRNAQALAGTERAMMDAGTVSEGIRNLRRFETPPQPGVSGVGTSSLTLEQFQDIRSTLSGELRDIRSLPAGTPNKTTSERFLRNTLRDMDEALAQSAISPEARAAYERARGLQITEKVEPFGTSVTAKLNQRGLNNELQILPEEVVAAFAKSESPATQYGVSFGRDPAAARDMAEGFSGLFRQTAIGEDGLVNAAAASKFIREHSPQLDVLERAGVRVRDQLTEITTEAARNARQREALTAESAKFKDAQDAKSLTDLALNSASDMDTVRRRLTPDARAALSAEVKNRALDILKSSNPDAAIEYLTSKKKAIEVALGKTGEAEHAAMLNAAKMQKRLIETSNAVPNTGLYDPAVLQAKFTPSQLASLEVANADIARIKQMSEVAKAGGNARVTPAPASWNDFVTSVNPLVLLKTAVAKLGKNWGDSRVNAEAFRVMYENPERFTAAVERAIAQTKRSESAREAARGLGRPATAVPTLTINRLAPPQENRNSMAR
jgi:hypothetical protein